MTDVGETSTQHQLTSYPTFRPNALPRHHGILLPFLSSFNVDLYMGSYPLFLYRMVSAIRAPESYSLDS